ncbi:hypothetical protein C1H46_002540 [Malus baccata]|uniref:Uncharacterized protein n=1 Tax=Malus baccata TaxID=106549 RepID=A0A540NLK0_MALBA|nr:hypothetical protein C1H46_002540 [Malus baccata]
MCDPISNSNHFLYHMVVYSLCGWFLLSEPMPQYSVSLLYRSIQLSNLLNKTESPRRFEFDSSALPVSATLSSATPLPNLLSFTLSSEIELPD